MACDQACGFMIAPQARRGFGRDRFVIEEDFILGCDLKSGRGQGLAIDLDAARFNQPFALAP